MLGRGRDRMQRPTASPGQRPEGPIRTRTIPRQRTMTDDPIANVSGFYDPRRRGFRSRASVDEVLALITGRIGPLGIEAVPLAEAASRVLAVEAVASRPMPPFDRAAMDGYAVRGEETFGAD